MHHKSTLATALLLVAVAVAASAQQNPASPPDATSGQRPVQAPLQIPEPRYVTATASIEVSAPAEKVWALVGKFCDVGRWAPSTAGRCKYLVGQGDLGTVRSVGNEVLVGKTPFSYTYARVPSQDASYDLGHGTLEVTPVDEKKSRLTYVLFYDSSLLPDDAARIKRRQDRESELQLWVRNMKSLVESARLPVAKGGAFPSAAVADPQTPYLNPQPHYVVVPMQLEVDAPADQLWSRIGHFCDIGTLGAAGYPGCMITSGVDGEYGVVRNIGREVLVGRTASSYTYAQQMRTVGFYLQYHGTVEARIVSPTRSTLYWTLVYDNSNLADDAARERDVAARRARFNAMMRNVKLLAEGGALP